MHRLGHAHNDLNPENIMLNIEDRPVVSDMSSAKLLESELFQMGTSGWNYGV